MGEVDIVHHPKSCLKKHPTTMKSHHRTAIRSPHSSTTQFSTTFTIPEKGILKTPNTNSSVLQNKNLVVGQVKILKRGETLQETSKKVLKDVNLQQVGVENVEVKGHRTRRVNFAENKKMEKKVKKMASMNPNRGVLQVSNSQHHVVVSSTNRIGPDPKIVSKQMKHNKMTECFSGSVFSDSPHPSSLPLPSFFMKNISM